MKLLFQKPKFGLDHKNFDETEKVNHIKITKPVLMEQKKIYWLKNHKCFVVLSKQFSQCLVG